MFHCFYPQNDNFSMKHKYIIIEAKNTEISSTKRRKNYRDVSGTFYKREFKCSNFPDKEWCISIFLIRTFDGSYYSANQIKSSLIVEVILKVNNGK